MLYLFNKTFQLGYDDWIFRDRSWNKSYESWRGPDQVDYEYGRYFASLFGDRYKIRNMTSPWEETVQMSEHLDSITVAPFRRPKEDQEVVY